MRRAIERFEGLGAQGKVLAALGAAAAISLASFFATLAFFPSTAGRQEVPQDLSQAGNPPSPQDSASASASPGTQEAVIEAQEEAFEESDLRIEGARWEGDEALVRGAWEGQLSSVQCDLWDGEPEGGEKRLMDWWDREEPVSIEREIGGRGGGSENGTEAGTFSRAFGKDEDGRAGDEPEAGRPYLVTCSGTYSLGLSINDVSGVEGNPPG